MEHPRQFNRFYWVVCAAILVLVIARCALVPFAHDEVATFNFYIQPGRFLPFLSHVDAMGHFLLSAASWLSFKLFGSSPLALRLPLIVSFLVLCVGVVKLCNLFSSLLPKLLCMAVFLLSYNFLAFYSLARGYGISMAFLVLALFYFYCYIRHFSFRHFWKFLLFGQLALAANLTLVMVLLVATGFVLVFQFRHKKLLSFQNLLLLPHFALIGFWVKFGFYLQANGALYYGGGDSYWQVTFQSLIETIALKSSLVTASFVLLFTVATMHFFYYVVKEKLSYLWRSNFAITYVFFCTLVIAFYLLKKLLGVNYPEDRTGLFFYVLFALLFPFLVSETEATWRRMFVSIPALLALHFVLQVNCRVHPWRIYETIPREFFTTLLREQAVSAQPITIGAHRLREFIYGFLNYNSPQKLGYATSPEALQMNCDYALAYAQDKPWYDKYYTELAAENDWGFRLLKRKRPLLREPLITLNNEKVFSGNYEYYNAFEQLDTTFGSIHPLIAEFDFTVEKAPQPFNAWLVAEISDASEKGDNVFVRIPLNLLHYDWNATGRTKLCLVTGNIPVKIKRIVCYLWNIEKQEINIRMHGFRLLRISGDGVTEVSNAKI